MSPSGKGSQRPNLGALLALALSLSGCSVSGVQLDNKSCPCIDGWVCDTTTDQCVSPAAHMGIVDAQTDGSAPLTDSATDMLDASKLQVSERDASERHDASGADASIVDAGPPDTDGDGVPDRDDGCPKDPAKVREMSCGCGVAETDTDGDGTPDCNDACASDRDKVALGACGCGVSDVDRDTDGTPDCRDACPDDKAKTAPGLCWCGTPEGSCTALAGLVRRHYSGDWTVLPAFDTLTSDATDVAPAVELGPYSGANNFGLLFTGALTVIKSDMYEFELGSDDGSRLFIDGQLVVENDRRHIFLRKTGFANLTAGKHVVRIEYFDGTGSEGLTLQMRKGAEDFAPIPAWAWSHEP